MREPPYDTELKPYGRALVDLARARPEIVCLSGDLTRQCEVDLFQDALPERFVNAGMAEANMMGVAGGLARMGHIPFVHTFGVFATRRPFDQVAMAIAYPNLPVRIVGFMPGISSPGGPSHQATDDMALMRALPNMTVLDLGDAREAAQAAGAIVDLDGPVYLRLKRGDTPVIFDDDHRLSLDRVEVVHDGTDLTLATSGMMLSTAIAAAAELERHGVSTAVVHVPTIKPIDSDGLLAACGRTRAVLTVENHSVIGGLGSAVAEVLAESGLGRPLRRIGLSDTFAEGAKTASHLFTAYGLSTQRLLDVGWSVLELGDTAPQAQPVAAAPGDYAPV